DEFAVLVSDAKDLDLNARATDIFKALSSPSPCDGHVVFPAATIGGALAETETNPDQIRQNAEVALDQAKEHNRVRYVQHYPGLGTALTRRFRAVRDVGV
ncbi:diguanylate cyclase domain-containing protein, partial [Rhizobium ruizarguesonis]